MLAAAAASALAIEAYVQVCEIESASGLKFDSSKVLGAYETQQHLSSN